MARHHDPHVEVHQTTLRLFAPLAEPQPTEYISPPEALLNAFQAIGGSHSNAITAIFADMAIAEDEITRGIERHPDQADALWRGTFAYLRRGRLLRTLSDAVYRAHCGELIDRYAENGDMDASTDAEAMALLCDMSMATPLNNDATGLYLRMFRARLPDQQPAGLEDYHPHESWSGRRDELRALLDKAIRKAWKKEGGRCSRG